MAVQLAQLTFGSLADLDEGKMLMNLREVRLSPVDDDDD